MCSWFRAESATQNDASVVMQSVAGGYHLLGPAKRGMQTKLCTHETILLDDFFFFFFFELSAAVKLGVRSLHGGGPYTITYGTIPATKSRGECIVAKAII